MFDGESVARELFLAREEVAYKKWEDLPLSKKVDKIIQRWLKTQSQQVTCDEAALSKKKRISTDTNSFRTTSTTCTTASLETTSATTTITASF
jgi:hypothetical protein